MRISMGFSAILLAMLGCANAQAVGASIGLTIRLERPDKPRMRASDAERCRRFVERAFAERSERITEDATIACDEAANAPLLIDPLAPPAEPVVRP